MTMRTATLADFYGYTPQKSKESNNATIIVRPHQEFGEKKYIKP